MCVGGPPSYASVRWLLDILWTFLGGVYLSDRQAGHQQAVWMSSSTPVDNLLILYAGITPGGLVQSRQSNPRQDGLYTQLKPGMLDCDRQYDCDTTL